MRIYIENQGCTANKAYSEMLAGILKSKQSIVNNVKDADLIIEAVVEDMDVKKKIFKTCNENAPPHAVIIECDTDFEKDHIPNGCLFVQGASLGTELHGEMKDGK